MKLLSVMTVCALSVASMAQVYDSGPPNLVQGLLLRETYPTAETFTIADGATIQSVQFWDIEPAGSVSNGQMTWEIYSDYHGVPNNVVDSGTTSFSHVSTGNIWEGSYPEYVDNFTLNTPFVASAGTPYWLAMQVSGSDLIYWETTNNNGTTFAQYLNTFGNWATDGAGYNTAFQLYGAVAPEPASVAVVSLALITLRRRRRS